MKILCLFLFIYFLSIEGAFTISDTGQEGCYTASGAMYSGSDCLDTSLVTQGQDAHFLSHVPQFEDNNDGTVTDLVTGLVWQQDDDGTHRLPSQSISYCNGLSLGGHSDWRLPSMKELFSISQWGDGSILGSVPWLDSNYFPTSYEGYLGQTWSSTKVLTRGTSTTDYFYFNFADGRIKGPKNSDEPQDLRAYTRCVRGDSYGDNSFSLYGSGNVVYDAATGLYWQQADDGVTRNWETALEYANDLSLEGFTDWRLPNVKELQSIVDYTSTSTPVIDTSFFTLTSSDAWMWSSTTFSDLKSQALYVCFGDATSDQGVDIHGPGAVRSDPKVLDPSFQACSPANCDEIRTLNYVLAVRGGNTTSVESPNGDSIVSSPASSVWNREMNTYVAIVTSFVLFLLLVSP